MPYHHLSLEDSLLPGSSCRFVGSSTAKKQFHTLNWSLGWDPLRSSLRFSRRVKEVLEIFTHLVISVLSLLCLRDWKSKRTIPFRGRFTFYSFLLRWVGGEIKMSLKDLFNVPNLILVAAASIKSVISEGNWWFGGSPWDKFKIILSNKGLATL